MHFFGGYLHTSLHAQSGQEKKYFELEKQKSISDLSLSHDFDGKGIYLDNSGDIFSNGSGFLGPHAINYRPDKIEGRDTTIPEVNESQNIGLLNLVIKKRQGDLLKLNRIKQN